MANHNVAVSSSAFYDSEVGWFYSSSSSPATLDIVDGDTVTWTYTQGSNGATSVSISAFDTGEWNNTALASLTNGQSVVRTYQGGAGNDTITVNFSGSFTDKTTVITVVSGNQAPNAIISGDTTAIATNSVSVDGGSSTDPDNDSLTYAYVVKQGTTTVFSRTASTDPSWFYIPTSAGTYVTTLTVDDGNGESDTATLTTTVYAASAEFTSSLNYGFEVFNADGDLVLDNRTVMIRSGAALTTDASGNGSVVISGVDANTVFALALGGAGTTASYTVTGSGTSRTVTLSNGDPSSTYRVSIMR